MTGPRDLAIDSYAIRNATRFWARVAVAAGCWEWTRARTSKGYGTISWKGRDEGAHRVSYMLTHGSLAATDYILHSCDNRGCVNPAHLRTGSHRDNMQDRRSRGRWKNSFSDATHCKRGHAFTAENTYVWRTGRYCRTCRRARDRTRWPDRREAQNLARARRYREHAA